MEESQSLQFAELKQEDLSQIIQRAQAISYGREASAAASSDLDAFVRAAEELGISREAVLQAVGEKLKGPIEGLNPGDHVWAKSADGAYYSARVLEIERKSIKVAFDHGSEHALPPADIKRFSLLPGQKVVANWPKWGWYTVDVVAFDPQMVTITATDGWSTKTFGLKDVRLAVDRPKREAGIRTLLWRTGVIGAGLGGLIGALLMRLFG